MGAAGMECHPPHRAKVARGAKATELPLRTNRDRPVAGEPPIAALTQVGAPRQGFNSALVRREVRPNCSYLYSPIRRPAEATESAADTSRLHKATIQDRTGFGQNLPLDRGTSARAGCVPANPAELRITRLEFHGPQGILEHVERSRPGRRHHGQEGPGLEDGAHLRE